MTGGRWTKRGLRSAIGLLAIEVAAGCKPVANAEAPDEFFNLGRREASLATDPGVFDPIGPGDLQGIQQRGVLLFDLQRSLAIALQEGAYPVGMPQGQVVLPLAQVDPGNRSSQVVFLRWLPEHTAEGGEVAPGDALRWLRVSLLLHPDRVLDVELLSGPVDPKSFDFRHAEALIAAAKDLRGRAPGISFGLFGVPEQATTAQKKASGASAVTRVYALASEGPGPDLELVVLPSRRKDPAQVVEAIEVHPAGAPERTPIELEWSQPAPATVARVLARGGTTEVVVHTSGGAWEISPESGRIRRAESTY